MLTTIIYDVLTILCAGLVAGLISRRVGASVLIGYLIIGAVIGEAGLGLIHSQHHEIEHIAEAGVFLLLFSIGLEFSLEELWGLGRNFFLGGGAQMLLVAVPVAVVLLATGVDWQVALLLAAACSFSSTVLVFKALSEWGQLGGPLGRRAIGVLLFQDAALIPLLLVVPLLTGAGETAGLTDYMLLAMTSVLFIGSVVFLRRLIARWAIPLLAAYRSPELIVLFTLVVLGGTTLAAYTVGLPPAIGAFTAGLVFSGNRWTDQVDALIFPFRESFAAIFFVSLGLIANPALLWQEPLVFGSGLLGIVVLKAVAALLALRLTGLRWPQAGGLGLGLAHIGEFAFVLVLLGWEAGLLSELQYQRFVSISLASLVLTPWLIKTGLQWAQAHAELQDTVSARGELVGGEGQAVIVGAGPTGRQVASRLEIAGYDVCIIDFSPVNLHAFSQQGFRTISGDATQLDILEHARVGNAALIIVCVSDDSTALRIAGSVRELNSRGLLLVRCRYHTNMAPLKRLGANEVVSEEAEAGQALNRILAAHLVE